MNQSTVIFGAVLIAFVIYVSIHGQLTAYLQVLGLSKQ